LKRLGRLTAVKALVKALKPGKNVPKSAKSAKKRHKINRQNELTFTTTMS
jgi:hypothetical protein